MTDVRVITLQLSISLGLMTGGGWETSCYWSVSVSSSVSAVPLSDRCVFVTITLYALPTLTTGAVASTVSATNIAAGLLGSVAYAYSCELLTPQNQQLALVLSVTRPRRLSTEMNSVPAKR